MTYDDFFGLVSRRHSTDFFDDRPVTRDEIEKILAAARLAPSVENVQPWHFHVILNPDLRRKMTEASCYGNFVEGAGAFIVVTCQSAFKPRSQEILWNPKELEHSCAAAIQHMLLAATALDLCSSWVSLHNNEVRVQMDLTDNVHVIGGVMIGHCKQAEKGMGRHHARKPLADMFTIHA